MEYVLVTNHRNFVKNSFFWRHVKAVFGSGLLTSEGDFWLRERRLCQPAFHREQIAGYGTVMVDLTAQVLAAWHDGEVRDVHQDMMRLTSRIASRTLLGIDVGAEVEEIEPALEVIIKEIAVRFRRPFHPRQRPDAAQPAVPGRDPPPERPHLPRDPRAPSVGGGRRGAGHDPLHRRPRDHGVGPFLDVVSAVAASRRRSQAVGRARGGPRRTPAQRGGSPPVDLYGKRREGIAAPLSARLRIWSGGAARLRDRRVRGAQGHHALHESVGDTSQLPLLP